MRSAYKHLAFTGTKKDITPRQKWTLDRELSGLRNDGFLWMHNGDCVGADDQALHSWIEAGGKIMLHPPLKDKYQAGNAHLANIVCEPQDYLVRNWHMVDCSELLVAAPLTYDEQTRSGTWATVRYADKLRLELLVILPDGSIR